MQCEEMQERIAWYACDELDGAERAAVEAHLEGCAACRAAVEAERRLIEGVVEGGRMEPSPVLLASCRNELNDALDVLAPPQTIWQRLAAALRPPRWVALHPAWSAAMFLVVGVVVGTQVPSWLRGPRIEPTTQVPEMTISGVATPASFNSQDLQNFSISGISQLPGEDPNAPVIEVQMTAAQPMIVSGTLDDGNVKRVLINVMQNNQRFDSGLRLDSVELLKTRSKDADVRKALCYAARHDRNPAVRLKALEALRDMGDDPEARQTMIDALLYDDNPGVRVLAINILRAYSEQAGASKDQRLYDIFRDRMQHDPSTYVRMQSAAAMRGMGPRTTY